MMTLLSRQIDGTDRQIDALVYELYGLSEEEVAIVEEAARRRRRSPWLRPSSLLAYPGLCAGRSFVGIEKERRRMRGPISGR